MRYGAPCPLESLDTQFASLASHGRRRVHKQGYRICNERTSLPKRGQGLRSRCCLDGQVCRTVRPGEEVCHRNTIDGDYGLMSDKLY